MGIAGLGVGFVAVLVAIAVPLSIEAHRRPRFVLKVEDSTVVQAAKFLHVEVVNEPMDGRRSKWLLRNTATGCVASLTLTELATGRRPVTDVPARWAARPDALTMLPTGPGTHTYVTDVTKLEHAFRMDVAPGEHGEVIVVAIKFPGEPQAYAFSKQSYMAPNYHEPTLELPGREYKLRVGVEAGGVRCEAFFRIYNRDATLDGFMIVPWVD